MYVSVSRLRVQQPSVAALMRAFRQRSGLVDTVDGFIDLQVWRSDRDPEEIWMVSRWRERSCFTAYMKSADHARSHDRIPQSLSDAICLERLEHLHSFEVAAE